MINNLSIYDYKIHSNTQLFFSDRNFDVITGLNGCGKTSLLKAINYFSGMRSASSTTLESSVGEYDSKVILNTKESPGISFMEIKHYESFAKLDVNLVSYCIDLLSEDKLNIFNQILTSIYPNIHNVYLVKVKGLGRIHIVVNTINSYFIISSDTENDHKNLMNVMYLITLIINQEGILLIDDIEKGLSITGQILLIEAIQKYKSDRLQIIATTSSLRVLEPLESSQIHILATNLDGITRCKRFDELLNRYPSFFNWDTLFDGSMITGLNEPLYGFKDSMFNIYFLTPTVS